MHIPQSPDLSQRTIDCSGRQMATMKSSKYINSARFARTGAFWKFLDVFQLWYEIKMFGWIWPIATASGTAKWIVQRRIAFIPCKASKQLFNYFCIWKKGSCPVVCWNLNYGLPLNLIFSGDSGTAEQLHLCTIYCTSDILWYHINPVDKSTGPMTMF